MSTFNIKYWLHLQHFETLEKMKSLIGRHPLLGYLHQKGKVNFETWWLMKLSIRYSRGERATRNFKLIKQRAIYWYVTNTSKVPCFHFKICHMCLCTQRSQRSISKKILFDDLKWFMWISLLCWKHSFDHALWFLKCEFDN